MKNRKFNFFLVCLYTLALDANVIFMTIDGFTLLGSAAVIGAMLLLFLSARSFVRS
jgi:hypothetical protein